MIQEEIPHILNTGGCSHFYLRDDPKIDRYFSKVNKLRKDPVLKSQTLAILDGTGSTITDLIFTSHGIVPARGQLVRRVVPYEAVRWTEGLKKELFIDGWYINEDVDLKALYALIGRLKEKAEQLPATSDSHFGNLI
jgi:hypothetical protein